VFAIINKGWDLADLRVQQDQLLQAIQGHWGVADAPPEMATKVRMQTGTFRYGDPSRNQVTRRRIGVGRLGVLLVQGFCDRPSAPGDPMRRRPFSAICWSRGPSARQSRSAAPASLGWRSTMTEGPSSRDCASAKA
jgi:hypothetical protein